MEARTARTREGARLFERYIFVYYPDHQRVQGGAISTWGSPHSILVTFVGPSASDGVQLPARCGQRCAMPFNSGTQCTVLSAAIEWHHTALTTAFRKLDAVKKG